MNQKGQGLKSAAQWCNQLNWDPGGGGGTPIDYLYGYVPPKGVVILKLLL